MLGCRMLETAANAYAGDSSYRILLPTMGSYIVGALVLLCFPLWFSFLRAFFQKPEAETVVKVWLCAKHMQRPHYYTSRL